MDRDREDSFEERKNITKGDVEIKKKRTCMERGD